MSQFSQPNATGAQRSLTMESSLTDGYITIENGQINNLETLSLSSLSVGYAYIDTLCSPNFQVNITSVSVPIISAQSVFVEFISAQSAYIGHVELGNISIDNINVSSISVSNYFLSRGITTREVVNYSTINNLNANNAQSNKFRCISLSCADIRTNTLSASTISTTTLHTNTFNLVPPGVIWPYGGVTVPSGFLACNGQYLNIFGTYNDLFNAIGFTWGSTSFGAFFRIPYLNDDRVLYGMSGPDDITLGTYISEQLQQHTHTISISTGAYALYYANENFDNVVGGGTKNVIDNIQNNVSGSLNQSLPVFINAETLSTGDNISGNRMRVRGAVVNYIIKY